MGSRSRKRRAAPPRTRPAWQPLQRGRQLISPGLAAHAAADPRARAAIASAGEVWLNDAYVVIVRRYPGGDVMHLSIRHADRRPSRARQDFMRIKDELAGPDVEAVELYPARDRLVDEANQYHLWCMHPGVQLPPGFPQQPVAGEGEVCRRGGYVVVVGRYPGGDVMHLSIRRANGEPCTDWRALQDIKDELAGPDVEAVELYPARVRAPGPAGQYELWCMHPGVRLPFGFTERSVLGPGALPATGARQRELGG